MMHYQHRIADNINTCRQHSPREIAIFTASAICRIVFAKLPPNIPVYDSTIRG